MWILIILPPSTGVNLGIGHGHAAHSPHAVSGRPIGNSSAEEYIKPALVLMIAGMVPVLLITTYWPDLCLFIPRALGFIK